MKFPPQTKTILYTSLEESEVLEQLKWVIESRRLFSFLGGGKKPYQGTIAGPFFTVSRTNSWSRTRLEIKGEVKSENNCSSINLELDSSPLRLEAILALVLCVLFVSLALFFSKFAVEAETAENNQGFWIMSIIPLGWYILEFFGYIIEWNISKKFFLEFFDAQETPILD